MLEIGSRVEVYGLHPFLGGSSQETKSRCIAAYYGCVAGVFDKTRVVEEVRDGRKRAPESGSSLS
jgi:hypothetical protein